MVVVVCVVEDDDVVYGLVFVDVVDVGYEVMYFDDLELVLFVLLNGDWIFDEWFCGDEFGVIVWW